jgi:hypothetical protein
VKGDNQRVTKRGHTSTQIIGHRELTVDRVQFQWWAVADRPALVTVRSTAFGSLAEFTYHDACPFAHPLATELLAQERKRTQEARGATNKTARTHVPALKKAEWFEVEPDFRKTVP